MMASKSKRCSLIWVVLFLCVLSFPAKALAMNINAGAYELYAASDEMGQSRRLLGRRPPCKRGRIAIDVSEGRKNQPKDDPRCHNYL